MILFIDPGGGTGYALFDSQGTVKKWGQVSGLDSLTDLLTMTNSECPLDKIFYEPYILRNSATKNMNRHQKKGHQDTIEAIGAIKTFGRINKIPAEEIRYVQLNQALAQTGITLPKNHAESHQYVALAYGGSYYIKQGIIKPSRLRHT